MPDDVRLSSFPASVNQALAFEYAKQRLTETTTPEEFACMYDSAYARIRDERAKPDKQRVGLRRQP